MKFTASREYSSTKRCLKPTIQDTKHEIQNYWGGCPPDCIAYFLKTNLRHGESRGMIFQIFKALPQRLQWWYLMAHELIQMGKRIYTNILRLTKTNIGNFESKQWLVRLSAINEDYIGQRP